MDSGGVLAKEALGTREGDAGRPGSERVGRGLADSPLPAGGRWSAEIGDLPSQVLDFGQPGFNPDDDGLRIPRQILDAIPSQLEGLRMQLEEAERSGESVPPGPRRSPVVGRIAGIPRVAGYIADFFGAGAAILFMGRLVGLW
jgi:hypothetical protein